MSKNVKKPYCKVCHDAGKTESVYTSHWVKDLTGKTTCPTLLDTECRYCYKLGHTAKFCDVLAKKNKEKERAERKVAQKPVVPKVPMPGVIFANGFAALCEEDDSEEEVLTEGPKGTDVKSAALTEGPVSEDAPAKKVGLTGWAAIAAKPKETKGDRELGLNPLREGVLVLTKETFKESKPKTEESLLGKPAPWATSVADSSVANSKRIVMKSWADWSDSEDEEEEMAYNTGKIEATEEYTDAWD